MKILVFTALTFIITFTSFAQSTSFLISGKVVDITTKKPLQAASVFAQSTTIGTATTAEGDFSLRLFNGGYDLVVTFTGYETVTRRITTADESDRNIVIEMKQKEKALEEVSIVTSNEVKDGWIKYGDLFIENFMGKTANSRQCNLRNPEALKFFFSKKRNRLKVTAAEPLVIENNALGYKIRYTLDSFTHDYGTLASTFTGYPLFEEMVAGNDTQKASWQQKRAVAYQGSILHFMRSVFNQEIKDAGFEIQFIVKHNDTEEAVPLKDFYGAINYSRDDSTQVVEISPNQTEMAVLFKNEMPDEAYLLLNADAPKKFELSVISIPAGQAIFIEQNGFYYNQNDISIQGYWSWEKAGDMLPYDYRPE